MKWELVNCADGRLTAMAFLERNLTLNQKFKNMHTFIKASISYQETEFPKLFIEQQHLNTRWFSGAHL